MSTAARTWRLARDGGWYALLALAALVVLFPLLYALSTSLLTTAEVATYPPRLIPAHLEFSNYAQVLRQVPIPRFILNSVVVSTGIMAAQLVTATLAAFAFAFLDFRGRDLLFFAFLATMMIPFEATVIPNYLTVKQLGWLNSFPGLTVPFLATGFGTFLLRQSFKAIPLDVQDAATIDGCSRLRFLWSIVVPLSRPALGTLGVYGFLQAWNIYLWPLLIVNSPHMQTVQIGIGSLQNAEQQEFNIVMAGTVLVLLPTILLLVLGQRQLIRGLTAGAVKA
jgi:sn-glycerol 3-phosphate transport system permease protein